MLHLTFGIYAGFFPGEKKSTAFLRFLKKSEIQTKSKQNKSKGKISSRDVTFLAHKIIHGPFEIRSTGSVTCAFLDPGRKAQVTYRPQ